MRSILRKIALCALLILASDRNFAQQTNDSLIIDVSLITTLSRTIITHDVSLFTTETATSIDSICTQNYQGQFVRAANKKVKFSGYDKFKYYWFRIILKNADPAPRNLMLLMAPVGMRLGKLFQKQNNYWKITGQNGYSVPFKDRPYLYSHYVFPVTVASNKQDTVYLEMDANYSYKSYGFVLITPKALELLGNKVYFSFGIIIGLLSLFLLINFYLYFTWKDKVQLWYTLYIGMLILTLMKNDQLDQEFFGWDSENIYFMTSILGIGAIAIAVLMQVIQSFLHNIQKTSVLYKVAFVMKINVLVSGLTQMITFYIHIHPNVQQYVFEWARTSTAAGILIIIAECSYSVYRGNRSAYFFLAGLIVFLIGAIQRIETLDTSSYFYPPYIFHYGMVIETLTISFGLIYRYRLERKKNYQYHKERETMKNIMEKLLLESKIEIQEQTLNTVFKEINNNVGKKINLVKQKITNLKSLDFANASQQLNDVRRLITDSNMDLRNLCRRLDTDYVKDIGLLKSIEDELEQCKRSGFCNATMTVDGIPYRFDSQMELILFRIYQEIWNVVNNSEENEQINVILKYGNELFEILIIYEKLNPITNAGETIINLKNLDISNLRDKASLVGAAFIVSKSFNEEKIIIRLPV